MTEVAYITSYDQIDNRPKVGASMEAATSNAADKELFRENVRLQTFTDAWPHDFIQPAALAKVGFFWKKQGDLVKCVFCKIEISRFEAGDQALSEHIRWSPNCPLLRRRPTNNVPINATELNELLPAASYDVCGSSNSFNTLHPDAYAEESSLETSRSAVEEVVPLPPQPIPHIRHPDYPMYAIEVNRFRTFDDWPKTIKQRPRELSDAGFFYTGKSDRVLCHSCGGGLRDWDVNDDPWEQHALWFNKCEYLKLLKGEDYIREVQEKFKPSSDANGEAMPQNDDESSNVIRDDDTENNMQVKNIFTSSSISTPSTSLGFNGEQPAEERFNESKLCKICYTNEYNTAFYPCGHVVACAKCASSVTTCPVCRKPFDNLIRIYLS